MFSSALADLLGGLGLGRLALGVYLDGLVALWPFLYVAV